MDFGSIILILAFAFLVGLILARPLMTRSQKADKIVSTSDRNKRSMQRSTLLAERDRILASIQELEADYELGKIPEEDFPEMRSALMKDGALVLQHLDELAGKTHLGTPVEGAAEMQEKESESDDLEKIIQARRTQRESARTEGSKFCYRCGKPLDKADRFCPSCGSEQ